MPGRTVFMWQTVLYTVLYHAVWLYATVVFLDLRLGDYGTETFSRLTISDNHDVCAMDSIGVSSAHCWSWTGWSLDASNTVRWSRSDGSWFQWHKFKGSGVLQPICQGAGLGNNTWAPGAKQSIRRKVDISDMFRVSVHIIYSLIVSFLAPLESLAPSTSLDTFRSGWWKNMFCGDWASQS